MLRFLYQVKAHLGWPRGGAGPEKRNRPVGRVLKSGTAPTGPLRKMEPPRGAGPRKWNRPAGRVQARRPAGPLT